MGRFNTPPDPVKIQQLLAIGVPDGPLAVPQQFGQANRGGKYHDTRNGCSRLRTNYPMAVSVDVRTTPTDKYCATCVDGPSSEAAKAYLRHAYTVLEVRRDLVRLRANLVADRTGVPFAEGEPLPAGVVDLDQPVELGTVTWERVSQVEALVRKLQAIRDDPQVAPAMLEWMTPVETHVRNQHDALRAAARASTSTGQLLRQCVLDLMGVHHSYSSDKLTPADTTGPVQQEKALPALCATGINYGERYAIEGYEGLVTAAWNTWRAEVTATDDLPAAREAVLARTTIGSLEPKFAPQFHRGPARVPDPGTGLWDWMVAEWRHQATAELTTVVGQWETAYQAALTGAADQPDKVVALEDWDLDDRVKDNASTRVLAQLPVVFDARHQTALVIAPGVVATWLEKYDVSGKIERTSYGRTAVVKVLCDVTPSDDEAMLATALRLWEVPDSRGRRHGSPALRKLAAAVEAAQGIHSAA